VENDWYTAGILGLLPATSHAAGTSGVSPKPVILESGLAYVEKKTKDGLLASVEQKVGQVSVYATRECEPLLDLTPTHLYVYIYSGRSGHR
jgi:hypothetical protein